MNKLANENLNFGLWSYYFFKFFLTMFHTEVVISKYLLIQRPIQACTPKKVQNGTRNSGRLHNEEK